jgi:hypothetical protein
MMAPALSKEAFRSIPRVGIARESDVSLARRVRQTEGELARRLEVAAERYRGSPTMDDIVAYENAYTARHDFNPQDVRRQWWIRLGNSRIPLIT